MVYDIERENINKFCQLSHESWLKQHRNLRGKYTPRKKEINAWIFNINFPWEELCPLWKMKQRGDHEIYIIEYFHIQKIQIQKKYRVRYMKFG